MPISHILFYGNHAGHLLEMTSHLENRLFIWAFWGIIQWCGWFWMKMTEQSMVRQKWNMRWNQGARRAGSKPNSCRFERFLKTVQRGCSGFPSDRSCITGGHFASCLIKGTGFGTSYIGLKVTFCQIFTSPLPRAFCCRFLSLCAGTLETWG